MTPRRGEVWWVDLDPTRGAEIKKTRPCVVVSDDTINRYRNTYVVIALSTTSPKELPLYVPVPSVSTNSQAVIDQIRALDRNRFRKKMGTVSSTDMGMIDDALRVVLNLP